MESRGIRCLGWFVLVGLALGSSSLPAQNCPPAPFGTDGFWASSSATNEIYRFESTGVPLGSFTLPGLSGPRSLTVTPDGDVHVASQFGDEILVCDATGAFSHVFSDPGLDGPTGGVIGPNGDYYVCSFGTNTILRFDATESLVATYSSPGLSGPNCIVFRPDGGFFVTGQSSNDVHSFDATGTSLGSFPTGQSSVMGAALDLSGRLLVAGGGSHDVKLFDCAGTELDVWSVAGGPQSIAVREDGTIFVTTFFTDQVRWFTPDGAPLGEWTGGDQIRGIEFFPAALPVFERGNPNGDGQVDLADAIAILAVLFSGAPAFACVDASDVNDDGTANIADPVALLEYLFGGGAPPPAPFGGPGVDPTPDPLGCLD